MFRSSSWHGLFVRLRASQFPDISVLTCHFGSSVHDKHTCTQTHWQKQYTCRINTKRIQAHTHRNTSPHVSARTPHCRHLDMSVTVCFVPVFPQTSKQLPGMSDCMTADKRAINISFLLANLYSLHALHLLLKLLFCDTDRFSCQNVCTCVCTLPSRVYFGFSVALRWSPKNESCLLMHTMSSQCSCKRSPVFFEL